MVADVGVRVTSCLAGHFPICFRSALSCGLLRESVYGIHVLSCYKLVHVLNLNSKLLGKVMEHVFLSFLC